MHTVYDVLPILEKLPFQIEAISAYEGHLVVGTKQGHLLMYKVKSESQNKINVALLRSNKNFSRKPILKIAAVPEHQILISLSDQIISINDLNLFNFPILASLQHTKGACNFDLDIKRQITLTGENVVMLRLVVCVKRNLQLYYWKGRQFQKLRDDILLPDSPRAATWCGESIAVAFKYEYWLIEVNGDTKELFATGKSLEPLMVKVGDDNFALQRDDKTVFIDLAGNAVYNYSLDWPEQPVSMVYDAPYLIGVLSKNVLIQCQEPKMELQYLNLEKAKMAIMSNTFGKRKEVFVSTVSNVWCLRQYPVNQQIPLLINSKDFSLAVKLSDLCDESDDAKFKMKCHIEKLHAFNLFCEQEYTKAMQVFLSLDTDLLFVIGMYPGLVPESYRTKYPFKLPQLSEDGLKDAMNELVDYLLKKRHNLLRKGISGGNNTPPGGTPVKKEHFLQIIDTTLLKVYLKTNESLIVPLLRMPDSHVSAEEGERVLRQAKKYNEVLLLLQRKGLHSRALELLLRHARRDESPLFGHIPSVEYLQKLGPEHLDLIFEYSGWILKEHPADGLQIFIGDESVCSDVEQLNRSRVYSFLKKANKVLIVPYLEHVINEWDDRTPLFHNEIVNQYREVVIADAPDPDDENYAQVIRTQEETRIKLLEFLKCSQCYTAATLLVHFTFDRLLEERAVLLGRLNQHFQALKIYIDSLDNFECALEYCASHYTREGPGSQVYVTLFNVLLQNSSDPFKETLNYSLSEDILERRSNIEAKILDLLDKFAHCIDINTVIKILPSHMSVNLLNPFIRKSLYRLSNEEKEQKISRGLSEAFNKQIKNELISLQKQHVILTDRDKCRVCSKRFTSSSAFAWFSNGTIVHFSCKQMVNQ